jgi:hypothetical protein
MPVVILLALLTVGGSVPAAVQADPREQLPTAIAHGIGLLEKKDYTRFMQDFISPNDLKSVLGSEPAISAAMAERFGTQKAPQVLQALREAQTATPAYEDNGQTAVYPLKTPIGSRNSMAFVKVGKLWYIRN